MRLRDYMLNEEKVNNADRKMLQKYISEPKNTKEVLKSFSKHYDEEERELTVKKKSNGVQFTYNMDFYDVTVTLLDIIDSMGYKKYRVDDEGSINMTAFTVIKK